MAIRKKIREINSRANEGIKKKIKNAKEDPRQIALVVVEVFLILLLIISMLFLFDPKLSFPDADNVPWELKLVLFLVALGLVFKLYSYTKDFRVKGT